MLDSPYARAGKTADAELAAPCSAMMSRRVPSSSTPKFEHGRARASGTVKHAAGATLMEQQEAVGVQSDRPGRLAAERKGVSDAEGTKVCWCSGLARILRAKHCSGQYSYCSCAALVKGSGARFTSLFSCSHFLPRYAAHLATAPTHAHTTQLQLPRSTCPPLPALALPVPAPPRSLSMPKRVNEDPQEDGATPAPALRLSENFQSSSADIELRSTE